MTTKMLPDALRAEWEAIPTRIVSYGGGVQSTALLVLAAQGVIPFPRFLISNVGDDSEHPDTLVYVREVAMPYAAKHGIELLELQRTRRDGTPETLYGRLVKEGSRSLPIPVRMANTGAPGTRSCTLDFKIRVIGKWLKEHGASEENPALVGVGFSTDEMHRANRKRAQPWELPAYPLLDLGLDRSACAQLIRDAGLPVPPKSACYFCPFHRPSTWAEQRRDEPELFWKSVKLERLLNERRDGLECQGGGDYPRERYRSVEVCLTHTRECERYSIFDEADEEWVNDDGEVERQYGPLVGGCHTKVTEEAMAEGLTLTRGISPGEPGRCRRCGQTLVLDAEGRLPEHSKDRVFFTRFGRPLDEAIPEAQPALFAGDGLDGPESCDEGHCWT